MEDIDPDAIPDRRLALLFACAHPAIDPVVRTPLMLQTVLGFDAAHVAPTLGARTAHAAAVGRVEGAAAGLAALDAITDDAVQRFQPAWAVRAHLLAEAGRKMDAVQAYERAISLTTDVRARRYLQSRLAVHARA